MEIKFKFFYETADAGNTDWRKNTEMFEVINGASRTDVFCRKYNQKPLNGGYAYSGADAIPLIRLPEMYYIVAECVPSASESADALNTVRLHVVSLIVMKYRLPDMMTLIILRKKTKTRLNVLMR